MKGLKQLGAMALAAALTITLAAPISANAEVLWTKDGDGFKTYTNEDTKESYSEKDYTDLDESDLASPRKAMTICTNSYNEYWRTSTSTDVAKFTNFKSKKKALKVKVIRKFEYTDPSNPKTADEPDFFDKAGNGYYRDVDGKIVKVEKAKLSTDMPKGYDSASYTVRFYTKKPGTYKVTYDAVKKDGTTVKKEIKIIAKDFGAPIKSVTFAGKDIYEPVDNSDASKNRLWTKGSGSNVTNAKSGKLSVTMASKDFKLKKIEIGTPDIETITDKYGDITTQYKKATSELDQAEGLGKWTWKKVKNGKKIKLSKVDTSKLGQEYNPKTTTFESKGIFTTTAIRITYYDKKNKKTEREVIYLNRIKK